MNIFLWIVQVLLALHTLMGSFWKFGNLGKILPFANSVPDAVWILVCILEIVCSLLLLAPLIKKSLGRYVPIAALGIALEMVVFSLMLLSAGYQDHFPLYYWLVVAAVATALAYARRSILVIKAES